MKIGIDLGGTYIRYGLIDEFENILVELKEKSEVELGLYHFIAKMIRLIKSMPGF